MLKKMVCAGLGALVSLGAFASEDIFGTETPMIWQKIIILSAGPAWAAPGENQYIYPVINPPTITQYLADNRTGILGSGEVVFGLQRFIHPCLVGQLGLGLAGTTDAKAAGVATVDGVPNIYAYQYKINQGRLELKGKLIRTDFVLEPYLSGSVGAGFNSTHDYIPTSADPVLLPAPWFAPHTTVGLSYTLGLGVQTMVNRHWQIGLGYEFADWGKSFLDPDNLLSASGVLHSVNDGLTLKHLYTNQALFSIAYVF